MDARGEHTQYNESGITGGKTDGWVGSLFEWVEAAVFSLVLVVLVFSFVCRTVGVNGSSMMNTLFDKERLLVTSFSYTPRQGDIVIVNRYTQEPLVKRVIAIEGDRIRYNAEENVIYLNDRPLEETYIREPMRPERTLGGAFLTEENLLIKPGQVFVMGDNRNDSLDSREYGPFSTEDIIGRAFYRIFPFDRFGGI